MKKCRSTRPQYPTGAKGKPLVRSDLDFAAESFDPSHDRAIADLGLQHPAVEVCDPLLARTICPVGR